MEYRFISKYIHISPKKLRFYLESVKKLPPKQALITLSLQKGRVPEVLRKAIKMSYDSAITNHKLSEDKISFKKFYVSQGPALKRFRAGGRGVAKPYKRRTSHVVISYIVKQDIISTENIKTVPKKPQLQVRKAVTGKTEKSVIKQKNGTKS